METRTRIEMPGREELRAVFAKKCGDLSTAGWGPRRRARFGFFTPDDWYEALLCRLVTVKTRWLDVGGGASLFPHNPVLARELAARCALLVGVDPSPNIAENPFVHEHAQSPVEDYATGHRFDLATFRMVAEHITDPPRVVANLHRLLAPGGLAVIYTVNRYSPIPLLTALSPQRLHFPVKRLFWGGRKKDTFPVAYKMNTRRALRHVFCAGGFEPRLFQHLDDLAVFSQFRALNWVEIVAWRCLNGLGWRYPENCLLGVYERLPD